MAILRTSQHTSYRRGSPSWRQSAHSSKRPGMSRQNRSTEHLRIDFLRTVCGLGSPIPPLTCGFAPIHTLKRNVKRVRPVKFQD